MSLDFIDDVRKKTCKQDMTETITTDRKARMAACEITHCQSKERGCGVLVYDQHVEDSDLSKYIITSSKVIQKENFAVGDYEVKFSKATKKIKTFDLKNVTKSVRHVASGLVVIFIESSYSGFKHRMGNKCSILSKSPLTVAEYDQSQQLFCYVGNQCYNVESNGESGEYVLKAVSDKSDTAAKSTNASGEIPNGTAIFQGADENVKAVGILNVVDDKPMVISPIWLKSCIAGILDYGEMSTDGVTTAYHASPSGNPEPPVAPADSSNGEPPDHANGELPTDGRTTADHESPYGNPEPPVAPAGASNREPPDHANGELPTDGRTTADHESPSGNPEPPVASTDASNGEPPDHVNGLSTDGHTTADHESPPGNPEPPVAPAGASNGEPPDHENGLSTDGHTTADHDSTPGNQDLPSLTGFPTQEEQGETSYNNDCLVSEKVYGNKCVQEKLSVGLDRTCHRVIKDWEHLACTKEISAPLEVRLSCKINSENNCTLMLFDVLTAEKEDTLTVQGMINALEAIKRHDVKKIITENRGDAYYTQSFSVFASSRDNSELIFKMANRLNQKSPVNKNWRDLGRHQFHLSEKRLDEIEFGQSTQILMKYLYTEKTDLTIGMFYDEVEKLSRRDVLKILRKFMGDQGNRERLMKDAIELDSDDMRDICVTLNKPSPGLKNWRHLARSSALGIPQNIYEDCEPGKCKSPTDTLFDWIFANKVNLTVGQLLSALREIDRNDLVKNLRDHFEQNPSGQGETA